MKKIKYALIGAGTRWTSCYSPWFVEHEDTTEIIAIAELSEEKRQYHAKKHNVPQEALFQTWEAMLEFLKDKQVDGVMICTSDHDHYEPAMACLEEGYHLLLEKPIAPTPKECLDIAKLAAEKQCHVIVAHILRYTPFFDKIKQLIDAGEIGTLQSIQHTENIGSSHMAHSFVRGKWNNKYTSNPIIIAKSCHDLDILLYLANSVQCSKVAAFGSLKHFTKDNAPEGSSERCTKKCPVYETCPYSIKTYLTTGGHATSVTATGELDTLEHDLEVGPYGRCVYYCDNNVCDSMSSILELEDKVNIAFTLSAFTDKINRTINVMGSHGQIRGNMEGDVIELARFGKGEGKYRNEAVEFFHPAKDCESATGFDGHGGGDSKFLEDFVNITTHKGKSLTSIQNSIQSHLVAFALEEAREDSKVVFMDEYVSQINS